VDERKKNLAKEKKPGKNQIVKFKYDLFHFIFHPTKGDFCMLNRKGQGSGVFQLLISAVVAMAILGVLLGILGIITPPGQDMAVIARDNLSQAFTKQGTVITSGKINISKGAPLTSTVGGPDLGIDSSQVCLTVDNDLESLFNIPTPGSLSYIGSSSTAVRVRAYCFWDASTFEEQVTQNLGLGLDNFSTGSNCPSNFENGTRDIACLVALTKG
jgi:hypothetical protein